MYTTVYRDSVHEHTVQCTVYTTVYRDSVHKHTVHYTGQVSGREPHSLVLVKEDGELCSRCSYPGLQATVCTMYAVFCSGDSLYVYSLQYNLPQPGAVGAVCSPSPRLTGSCS